MRFQTFGSTETKPHTQRKIRVTGIAGSVNETKEKEFERIVK